jgi:hypothetical protein
VTNPCASRASTMSDNGAEAEDDPSGQSGGQCEGGECHELSDNKDYTQMTCDVLCSLGGSSSLPFADSAASDHSDDSGRKPRQSKSCPRTCPKQLQLPMFLSSKFFGRMSDISVV